ncbi:MAG: HD domain-containing protein [Pirellulaceae bacterium]|jgi:HD superfamily phosphohydrolase|nr:HD domain-containing protein [Pirellulaceae bacterium]
MSRINDIPEVAGLDRREHLIRIPQEVDVPITPRVRQLVDTAEFRRLSRISQLGLVGLVYPAALHTRFEHSLGVYRLALLYLKQLAGDVRFAELIQPHDAERLIVAALLHDLGHWPFCHPIEDMNLPGVPQHELFANSFLLESEIGDYLRDDWGIAPREIVALLSEEPRDARSCLLSSILSGPIDVDKMDYLARDSLHAGVPYGRNFDQQRLIGSLCVNAAGDGLAITDKGRTAAEMMVFARYVMFSEVYWHHAVRCGTAMLQRAFYLLHDQLDLDTLFRQTEADLVQSLRRAAGDGPAGEVLDGLFGPQRRLYKRFAQYSAFENPDQYHRLTRRPFAWLAGCAEQLAALLQPRCGVPVRPHDILVDAPPTKLEVQFNIEIFFPKEDCFRPLSAVSPVVRTLVREQFDDYVKRVRIFVHPRLVGELARVNDRDALVRAAVERVS